MMDAYKRGYTAAMEKFGFLRSAFRGAGNALRGGAPGTQTTFNFGGSGSAPAAAKAQTFGQGVKSHLKERGGMYAMTVGLPVAGAALAAGGSNAGSEPAAQPQPRLPQGPGGY